MPYHSHLPLPVFDYNYDPYDPYNTDLYVKDVRDHTETGQGSDSDDGLPMDITPPVSKSLSPPTPFTDAEPIKLLVYRGWFMPETEERNVPEVFHFTDERLPYPLTTPSPGHES